MCHIISKEYERFLQYMPTIKVGAFYSDKRGSIKASCHHIVVGASGRILALVQTVKQGPRSICLNIFIHSSIKPPRTGHSVDGTPLWSGRYWLDPTRSIPTNRNLPLRTGHLCGQDRGHLALDQVERLSRYREFKDFQKLILVDVRWILNASSCRF
uniref:Uncharacterized protein n=1 Tax=Strigamia maritima TaxID=126957 RepID=T1IR95_STRMM